MDNGRESRLLHLGDHLLGDHPLGGQRDDAETYTSGLAQSMKRPQPTGP